MRSFLRRVPIELYSVFVPSVLLAIGMLVWAGFSPREVNLIESVRAVSVFVWRSDRMLVVAFTCFWLLLAVRYIPRYIHQRYAGDSVRLITSFAALHCMYGVFSMCLSFSLLYLFYLVEPGRVYAISAVFFQLERALFGALPALWFIERLTGTFVEVAILYAYWSLFAVFSLAVVLTALRSTAELRRLLLAFFIVNVLAIPLFTLIPVLYPDGLLVYNTVPELTASMPADHTLSPLFLEHRSFYRDFWLTDPTVYLSVSAFPSLHAAWGLIATLAVVRTRRKLGVLFVAWYLLNALGTFYTLQHFMLDTIAGMVLAVFVYYSSARLLAFERTYYQGKDWFSAVDHMQHMFASRRA